MRRGCFLLWAAGKPAEAGTAASLRDQGGGRFRLGGQVGDFASLRGAARDLGGFTSLIEVFALTVVYALVMQTLIHLCRIPPRAQVDEFPRRSCLVARLRRYPRQPFEYPIK